MQPCAACPLPCVDIRLSHAGMPPALDIHVDNGVPGEDVISMRISLGSNGQPTINDGNAASIEDMLKQMLSPETGTAGDSIQRTPFAYVKHSCAI